MELGRLFRILAAIGALVFTAYQSGAFIRDYRAWQASMKTGDRSGRDLYGLEMKIDCAEVLVAWGFAAGLIYVLRPKSSSKP